ncbi:hypothetical protein CAC42_1404 [Sphaceloma murrayae]|uniref:Uncharacterized protein n=1 Tax=Sphaceloma murrayae TaxID=2082308 RepID=A0A2K1QGC6_9PEZI|nr:hypothetical protein CAC42_1404 [Sphaceloma murrayae]
MPTTGTPQTWTLLFKYQTSTILLHAARDQTFTSLKSDLLSALRATSRDDHFAGLPIPSDPSEVHLGKPLDAADLSKGWETVEPTEEDEEMEEAMEQLDGARGKGKGRAAKKSSGLDCPAGAGLRDGSVLAFRFGMDSEWEVQVPTFDDYLEEPAAELPG